MTTPDPRISDADWATVQHNGELFGVDPLVLLAIACHESGCGTLGDGRPNLDGHGNPGHGNVMGVGSYDSGSRSDMAGWDQQSGVGAHLLVHLGVHTINDIAAGKCHVSPNVSQTPVPGWSHIAPYGWFQPGSIKWASGDNQITGFSWTRGVVEEYNRLSANVPHETNPTDKEQKMIVNFHPGGSYLSVGGKLIKLSDSEHDALVKEGVPAYDLPFSKGRYDSA